MKHIYLVSGKVYVSYNTMVEQHDWIEALPKMQRTGSDPYYYSPMMTRITFKRNDDAVAFRLKFGL